MVVESRATFAVRREDIRRRLASSTSGRRGHGSGATDPGRWASGRPQAERPRAGRRDSARIPGESPWSEPPAECEWTRERPRIDTADSGDDDDAMSSANLARKRPHQARARATVAAILEATVQILERESLDAATTTHIAEIAGVSIGSLYQYFPHRDAILNALQDREFERALSLLHDVLAEGNLEKHPRETVTAVVRGLAGLYRSCPGLHRVLAIEGLRVAEAERVHAFDLRAIRIVEHFLAATSAGIRRRRIDAAAFVAFQSVRAVMLANLLQRPPGLDEEALIEELVDLVLGYLVEPDVTPRATGAIAGSRRRGPGPRPGTPSPRRGPSDR